MVGNVVTSYKRCKTCLLLKPLDDFIFEPRVKDRRTARCRECVYAAQRAWNAAHFETVEEYQQRRSERRRKATESRRGEQWKIRDTPEGRRCSGCRRRKSPEDFGGDVSQPDGLSVYCRTCANAMAAKHQRTEMGKSYQRNWIRKRTLKAYGLTPEDFDARVAAQDNKCGLCREPFADTLRSKQIDHDHETGTIRGILCVKCNAGLGQFRDNEEYLMAAIEYLRRHRA